MAAPADLVAYLHDAHPSPKETSRVRLLRMAYLADWKSAIERGRQMTGLVCGFGEEGPYCREAGRAVHLELRGADRDREGYPSLTAEDERLLDSVVGSVEGKGYAEFEKLAYSTYPIATHPERGSKLDLEALAEEYWRVRPQFAEEGDTPGTSARRFTPDSLEVHLSSIIYLMAQQGQASQPQREGPPPGWRYPARPKHRSRFGGRLVAVWGEAKDNAALLSLFGVLLTLVVTAMLAQFEGILRQNLEAQRAEAAARVAEQQARQESLQTYLGDMGELILRDTSPLPEASSDDAVSRLARAKTLTVLGGLDAQGKGIVVQFLGEAQLIQGVEEEAPIIALAGADLSDADMNEAVLRGADLLDADLSHADASRTNLGAADLRLADLSDADLNRAFLQGTNLTGADLRGADLRLANLAGADLSGANLNHANLSNAQWVTADQIERQGATLEGATMPDGSEHP